MSFFDVISKELGSEKIIHYSLDRFRLALNHLGNPQKDCLSFVVGGTNGKGSTALFISAGLREAGFKVVTFLSPHLQSPVERFLLDLVPISEEELESLTKEYLEVGKKYELTYFEFCTLLCFVWASKQEVDFLVLEVGMGGRLDATNVTDPLACAITNIGFDHQQFLGTSKESILKEKLGILNCEGLLFTAIEDKFLLDQVEARCAELDAIYYYAKELRIVPKKTDYSSQIFSVNDFDFEINSPLAGFRKNAALAFLLLRIVFPRIEVQVFQKAFSKVQHPGRFEIVQEEPRVILSGDHNLEGVENLLETLRSLNAKKIHTICAFSPDKPYIGMASKLKDISDSFHVSTISRFNDSYPELYFSFHPIESDAIGLINNKLKSLGKEDTLLITGSLYFVGELRKLWKSKVEFLKSSPIDLPPTSPKLGVSSLAKPRSAEQEQIPSL